MGIFLSTAPRVTRALAEQCVEALSTSTDGKTGEGIPSEVLKAPVESHIWDFLSACWGRHK